MPRSISDVGQGCRGLSTELIIPFFHGLYILMVCKPDFLEIGILRTHPRLTESKNVGLRPGIYTS